MGQKWTFLTNHGAVFLHLHDHPGDTIRRVSDELGLAERTVAGIIAELRQDGYLLVEKQGKQNIYTVDRDLALRQPSIAEHAVSTLIDALAQRRRPTAREISRRTTGMRGPDQPAPESQVTRAGGANGER